MPPASGPIRTPDQRLRVFVSSTLNELATERKAVRRAIERLHLAPVMFELGARPHPPRELYRAYLEQSDVFVGLYWQRYGWVAPGESVSGLEDEYLLSSGFPKLIYIKEPSDSREARLVELLEHVLDDGNTSYKRFSTSSELTKLIAEDLAIMLAERFDASRAAESGAGSGAGSGAAAPGPAPGNPDRPARNGAPAPAAGETAQPGDPRRDDAATELTRVPVPLTELIGREDDIDAVQRLLSRPAVRMVTLLGPGGVGKSRLAIDVANRVGQQFAGGAAFVDLSAVTEAGEVMAAIAQALGIRNLGDTGIGEKVLTSLAHRELLLVIDNFEQDVEAGRSMTDLLAAAPGIKLLVTSRTLLRLSAERAFEVDPLGQPDPSVAVTADAVSRSSAVQLFVERARAVKPDFAVTEANAAAIAQICRSLDGIPLAIELAAARVRLLPPTSMLKRLDRQLPLLVGGVRDLPSRQQTLRSAIEWSTQLLGTDERRLLALIGAFAGPFSYEALDFLATDGGVPDTLTSLGALVDNSLVRQQDRGDRSLFSVLSTVREYAREQLEAEGLLPAASAAHARYYVELAREVEPELEGERQLELAVSLGEERADIAAAVRHLLDERHWEAAAELVWNLYIYWWVDGLGGLVHGWMEEVLAAGEPLTDQARAIAQYFACALMFRRSVDQDVADGLQESADLFRRGADHSGEGLARLSLAFARLDLGQLDIRAVQVEVEAVLALFRRADDKWSASLALIALGRLSLARQDFAAADEWIAEALRSTREQRDELGEAIALHHVGWARLASGNPSEARDYFMENLQISARLRHDEGVAYAFEGLIAIAAATGQVGRAGLLFGSVQALRERSGIYGTPESSFHLPLVEAIQASDGRDAFEAERARGWTLPLAEVIRSVLRPTGGAATSSGAATT